MQKNVRYAPSLLPGMPGATRLPGLRRKHAHSGQHTFLAHIFFKFHDAVPDGENGKIPAQARACPRMHAGPELAHDDVARKYGLTAETFDTPALSGAVAAVA
jgi:hypothetical protein